MLRKQAAAASSGLPWPPAAGAGAGARAAVGALLRVDPAGRLGASRGVDEIRAHDFFAREDWQAVASAEAPGPPFDESLGHTLASATASPQRPRRVCAGGCGGPGAEAPDPFEGF
ncbi:unnamed protein product [Prorocentrum cordatum]|uniref:AGC-kinase C-terminal domain-containing protein n=1 Tax=Prorocentrum cordatum TaxID=2364126 RepID=A0ABN9RRV3_9DINO|nr:unnamed protein product [Polarella glacialis]